MGDTKYETIGALVDARLNELGWSGRQAGIEAEKLGISISVSTINKVRRNLVELSAERLSALAQVLRIPVSEVAELSSRGQIGAPFADELPRDVNLLTRSERDIVLRLIGEFLIRHQAEKGED